MFLKVLRLIRYFLAIIIFPFSLTAQVDENEIGAWYMLFINNSNSNSKIEFEADFQYRNWRITKDLQQIIVRSGAIFKLNPNKIHFSLGYGFFRSEAYGESKKKIDEHRIHQDIIIKNKIKQFAYLTERLRLEERWVQDLEFTFRARIMLVANIPLNNKMMSDNTIFISTSNEIFFNLISEVGKNIELIFFDRNWTAVNFGYQFKNQSRIQLGLMYEISNVWNRNQLQFIYTKTL